MRQVWSLIFAGLFALLVAGCGGSEDAGKETGKDDSQQPDAKQAGDQTGGKRKDDEAGKDGEKSDPLAKLKDGTRDLEPPLKIGDGTSDPDKTQVLVYYANDSSGGEAGGQNVATLVEWLRSSQRPDVAYLADGIERDATEFSKTVADEVAAIKSGLASLPEAERPAVVIVTNALAREGRIEVAPPGEEFATIEVALPELDDPILKSYPLASPQSLEAVLSGVTELFEADAHEYVLVTKSHGTPKYALTTRVAVDCSQVDRETVVSRLEANAAKRVAKFEQDARPLTNADGEPVEDAGGGLIHERAGRLKADGRGTLRLVAEDDAVVLADLVGAPFETAGGKRIVLADGALRVEGAESPLQLADGKPAVVEVLVGGQNRAIRLAGLDAAAILETVTDVPRVPLVGTAEHYGPAGKKALDGQDDQAGFGEFGQPVLDDLKMADPILGKANDLGKPPGTLGMDPIGDLGIDPIGDLGVDDDGNLIAEPKGTTKAEYVAALIAAGERGQHLPVVFVESCKSHLAAEQTELLEAQAENVGYLWTSDLNGLEYTTIDYADVFRRVAEGSRLSQAMMDTLLEAHRQQQATRAESGSVPARP